MTERHSDYPIAPWFLQRWSPRAFTGEPLDEATLLGFIEAARWAPSGFNAQPWRFVYALRDDPAWEALLGLLSATNRAWAQQASALVLVVSQHSWVPPGKSEEQANGMHAFDAGAAWAYLALQASVAGWHAHGIGGFDRERSRDIFGIPASFSPQLVVALGRRADKSVLPQALQAREQPSHRVPLQAVAAHGRFSFG